MHPDPPFHPGRRTRAYSRRGLLTAGAAGTAAGVLAGCRGAAGAAGGSGPAPTPAQTGTHLLIQLNWQGVGGSFGKGPLQRLAEQFLQQNWADKHPGVTFSLVLGGGSHMGNMGNSATVLAVLAGTGPDLVEVCCNGIPTLEDTDLLLPLDALVRRDNLDLSIFPSGVLSGLRTSRGLLGFPNAGQTEPLYVNLALLDNLGLPYPDPSWDWTAAAELWRQVAGKRKGQQVYGACLNFAGTLMRWLARGFGGEIYDATRTISKLDDPATLRAFQWLVPLIQSKVVVPRQNLSPISAIQKGNAAFATACCGSLGSAVAAWGTSFKWDLIPMPAFAVRRTNGIFHALYGINSLSKAPTDLLWDLLKFICVEKQWQLFWNARLALAAPNQITPALWDEWIAVVQASVPFLKGKHLQYYADAAKYGEGWAFAKYSAAQATALENAAFDKLKTQSGSITGTLQQAANQITALEKAAGQAQAAGQKAQAQFPTTGPRIAGVPTGI